MNPVQRILGGMNFGPFGDRGAINHNNGNAQVTRGLNFGIGAAPTCVFGHQQFDIMVCLLYTSPSPRDLSTSRMPSSA